MTVYSGGKREWSYWYWTFGSNVAEAVVVACGSSRKYVSPSDIVYYEHKCLYLFVRLISEIVFDHHNHQESLLARFGQWHYDNCFDFCDICDALAMFDRPADCDAP